MLLSTSNSKARAPRGAWGRIWILTLALAITGAVGAELGLRRFGYEPSLTDSPEVWALFRASVYPRFPGEKVIVLIGGSRIQLDVDRSLMEKELGDYRVVQLAIDGSSALPVLYDLARDTAFVGSVLASFRVADLVRETGRASEYVDHFHRSRGNLNDVLNSRMRLAGESRFVVRGAQFRFLHFFQQLLSRRRLPEPPYIRMLPDRSIRADYTRLDVEDHRRERLARAALAQEEWESAGIPEDSLSSGAAHLARAVEEIQRRGGQVALIRFPVGEELWRMQDQVWPRARYWDALEARTDAITLHFKEAPALDAFPLPDESHLDFRDAPAFTRSLLEALRRRGFPAG